MARPRVDSTPKLILLLLVAMPLYALFILGPAGTWRWPEGWLFLATLLTFAGGAGHYVMRNDPELAEERMWSKWPERVWDRLIVGAMYPFMIASIVLPGLDRRLGWSSVPVWLEAAGFVAIVAGFYWVTLVMRENTFLSPSVKIQEERGHEVITTGPYAVVRHPMYLGVIAIFIGLPLLLGSTYTFVPIAVVVALLVVRTVLEDRTLYEELAGYPEYAQRTRFRLVPGLW